MRWDQGHNSNDVEDNRGQGGGGGGFGIGGMLGLLPFLIRTPFGWVIILLMGGFWLCTRLGGVGGGNHAQSGAVGGATEEQEKHFVSFVLDDTQATWTQIFDQRHQAYRHAKLVLFTDGTRTGCGFGDAATGPFYCPQDEHVYIDLGFYQELSDRLGAKGEFAKAYVVAHEIGHHVQKLLGISEKAAGLHGPEKGATGASVRLELQADCFAGIWAHSTGERKILDSGDIESALGAAKAIGDDRLQKMSTGAVSPEKWTHGSSEERMRWFQTGYDKGSVDACDTFAASQL
ncbi:MAG: neutral zinc metallopeptidase [Polyangiales bacterium]